MNIVRHALVIGFGAFLTTACYATVRTEPGGVEHCRNVAVRNRGDVERCHTRCNDDHCRTVCREHERVSREQRCWVD